MKTIIKLLNICLLIIISVGCYAQEKLTTYNNTYDGENYKNHYMSNEPVLFKNTSQSEINLGLHKFAEQHKTGNHLLMAGLVITMLGGALMYYSYPNLYSRPPGIFFTAVGGGLTTTGLIINLNSFRYLR
jgi:hypothetical protein